MLKFGSRAAPARSLLAGVLAACAFALPAACTNGRTPETKSDPASGASQAAPAPEKAATASPSSPAPAAPAAGGTVVQFTDGNFESEVLRSKEPVLVDFTAVWCGPCRLLAPTIDELAKGYAGRARIGKLDIDKNPKAAAAYGVNAVPNVIFFKDGKVVDRIVGLSPKAEYQKVLDKHAAPAAR